MALSSLCFIQIFRRNAILQHNSCRVVSGQQSTESVQLQRRQHFFERGPRAVATPHIAGQDSHCRAHAWNNPHTEKSEKKPQTPESNQRRGNKHPILIIEQGGGTTVALDTALHAHIYTSSRCHGKKEREWLVLPDTFNYTYGNYWK